MASDFTATLSDPGYVSGSSAGSGGGGAAALGVGLGGLANLLDVGLKASNSDREKKVTADLQTKLFPDIQAFAAQNTPPALLGQATDPNLDAAKSTPDYQTFVSSSQALQQVNAQGAMSREAFFAKVSAKLQQAINNNPRFAGELRQAAQDILGVNPTAQMVALQQTDQATAKNIKTNIQTGLATDAANSGVVYYKEDGSPDIDKMAKAGTDLNAAKANTARVKSEIELNNAKNPPLTQEQIQDQEYRGVVKSFAPVFNNVVDSAISRLSTIIEKNQNLPQAQQAQLAFQEIGNIETRFTAALNRQLNSLDEPISAQATANVRSYFTKQFDVYREWSKGGLSSLQTNMDSLQKLKLANDIGYHQTAPTMARVTDVFGNGATTAVGAALSQNTDLTNTIDKDLLNFVNKTPSLNTINQAADAASGKTPIARLPDPQDQANALRVVRSTLKHYQDNPNGLTDKELTAFGHGTVNVLSLGLQTNDPQELRNAAGDVNTIRFVDVLDRFNGNQVNSDQAQVIGKGALDLNHKAIDANARLLTTPLNLFDSKGQTYSFGNRGEYSGVPKKGYKVTPEYNPDSGQVEFKIEDEDLNVYSQDKAKSLGITIPKETVDAVNMVNKSLNIVPRLQKYGDQEEQSAASNELRNSYIAGTGIQIKEGTTLTIPKNPVQDQQTQDADPNAGIHAAIRTIESNNNPNIPDSNKGAKGLMQTMPGTLRDPGYGVTPAKDNSPEEQERVGREFYDAMANKYQNQTLALAAYNWGPGHVDKWLREGAKWSDLPAETRDYIGKVNLVQGVQGRTGG